VTGSLSGSLLFGEFYVRSMGLSVMLAAMCAAIASVTVLPALLCVLDNRVFLLSTAQ
jgi:uncharacterized membrane protein YdfJ with MMPL/SSD domain